MRACRCFGALLTFAFHVLQWAGLRAHRPNVSAEEIRCDQCGRVWRFDLRVTPAGVA